MRWRGRSVVSVPVVSPTPKSACTLTIAAGLPWCPRTSGSVCDLTFRFALDSVALLLPSRGCEIAALRRYADSAEPAGRRRGRPSLKGRDDGGVAVLGAEEARLLL